MASWWKNDEMIPNHMTSLDISTVVCIGTFPFLFFNSVLKATQRDTDIYRGKKKKNTERKEREGDK